MARQALASPCDSRPGEARTIRQEAASASVAQLKLAAAAAPAQQAASAAAIAAAEPVVAEQAQKKEERDDQFDLSDALIALAIPLLGSRR
jgi:hypothetical protein